MSLTWQIQNNLWFSFALQRVFLVKYLSSKEVSNKVETLIMAILHKVWEKTLPRLRNYWECHFQYLHWVRLQIKQNNLLRYTANILVFCRTFVITSCKNGCLVDPRNKTVPPQVCFDFTAFLDLTSAEKEWPIQNYVGEEFIWI